MSKKFEKCITLMITSDFNQKQIAEELKVTEQTISNWKKREDFQKLKKEMQQNYLNDQAAPALKTLSRLLKAKSELVRLQAATDILDRTGYKPVDRKEIEHTGAVQFIDDIGGMAHEAETD